MKKISVLISSFLCLAFSFLQQQKLTEVVEFHCQLPKKSNYWFPDDVKAKRFVSIGKTISL
jgi:hypothetical protein